MALIREPNILDPDGFYEELIAAQADLSEESAQMLLSKLVLLLANHVGDRAILSEAIALARPRRPGDWDENVEAPNS